MQVFRPLWAEINFYTVAKIGDKVRFLNEIGGGRVVKILDKRTVLVESEDGFEIPTLNTELVVVNTDDYNRIIEDSSSDFDTVELVNHKSAPQKAITKPAADVFSEVNQNVVDEKGDEVSLQIALVPKEINRLSETDFDLYLINDSTYRVFYTISQWVDGLLKPIKSSVIGSDTKKVIKAFKAVDFHQMLTINIQAVYYKNIAFKAQRPEYFDVDINPVKMQKTGVFTENDFFEEPAYMLAISDTQREAMLLHSTQKAIAESIKHKDVQPSKSKPTKEVEMEEVDLHIHELIDNWQGMTPGEIIKIQLARFETALETGLRSSKTRRMVFIHGLGNGKLKYELTKVLDNKYSKLRYQDASFKEYGYGATLVYLK